MSGRDGNGVHAVIFANATGDPSKLMTNIQCANNNFGPPGGWSSTPILLYPTAADVVGADFVCKDNNGDPDQDFYSGQFEIDDTTVPPFTVTVTGLPFNPRTLQINAVVPSTGVMSQCQGSTRPRLADVQTSNSIAADSGGFVGTTNTSAPATGFPIILYDGAGNQILNALINGYTADGFTVGVSLNTFPAFVDFTAYP